MIVLYRPNEHSFHRGGSLWVADAFCWLRWAQESGLSKFPFSVFSLLPLHNLEIRALSTSVNVLRTELCLLFQRKGEIGNFFIFIFSSRKLPRMVGNDSHLQIRVSGK